MRTDPLQAVAPRTSLPLRQLGAWLCAKRNLDIEAISDAHSRACKCCLCGSKRAHPSPLVSTLDEAAPEADNKRPWAKYRKVVPREGEEPVRVPEGRLCLPCFNVFILLGREGRVLQDLSVNPKP